MRHFIPELVDRGRGDYVSSKHFNQQNMDIYNDLTFLLEKEIISYAKAKILGDAIKIISDGELRAREDENVEIPCTINLNSEFIFPDTEDKCIVNKRYGTITIGINSEEDQLIDSYGKVMPGVIVERSTDNLVFSRQPDAMVESRIRDAFESNEFPYLFKVTGIKDTIDYKIKIEKSVGEIEFNCIEFIPFPNLGGTALKNIEVTTLEMVNEPAKDPSGETIHKEMKRCQRYRPLMLITNPYKASRINISLVGYSEIGDMIRASGIEKIKITNKIFKKQSYIGFIIPKDEGKYLKGVHAVLAWNNRYMDEITFFVYDSLEEFKRMSNNTVSVFDKNGIGNWPKVDSDLYVLVKVESRRNTSPQIVGFNYEIDVI